MLKPTFKPVNSGPRETVTLHLWTLEISSIEHSCLNLQGFENKIQSLQVSHVKPWNLGGHLPRFPIIKQPSQESPTPVTSASKEPDLTDTTYHADYSPLAHRADRDQPLLHSESAAFQAHER